VSSASTRAPATAPAAEQSGSPARERIVAAGIQVFGRFGFAKATVQEIAAAAHVSKPLFYRQFKNKQHVFEVVVERVFSEWHEAMIDRVARTEGGTAEVLSALFVGTLEYGREHPLLKRLLTRDSQLLLSTQSDMWDRACSALRGLIEQILREGREAGEVRSEIPIEHMADLLTEINFTYTNRQLHSGVAVGDELAESIAGCMLGGVLAR